MLEEELQHLLTPGPSIPTTNISGPMGAGQRLVIGQLKSYLSLLPHPQDGLFITQASIKLLVLPRLPLEALPHHLPFND